MLKNKRIHVLGSLLLFSIFFISCGKDVPNVPIYIDMNGFQEVYHADDFEDKLKSKLESYNFCLVNDTTAPYKIIVYDFYYYTYYFDVDAPWDDCDDYGYRLQAYEYGLDVDLVDQNNRVLENWKSSKIKEDDLKEDYAYSNCTTYKVDEPNLLGNYFFREEASSIARKTSRIVAEEYE